MIFSFDIGGSSIRGAPFDSHLDPADIKRRATPGQDFHAFTQTLSQIITSSNTRPQKLAFSIAGVIDPDTGTAICANIPCIHGRRLQEDLETTLGLPVFIANDADCFAIAEAQQGAGRGHRVMFGAILGTGVGGGLVIDGKLINSNGGFAGEWGHTPAATHINIASNNPPLKLPVFRCGCGQSGCVDTVGGARGLERLHHHFHRQELTSEQIVAAWDSGDPKSALTIAALIEILSAPLALTLNVTGATIIPVGGGLANSAALIRKLDIATRKRILRQFQQPVIVPAQCQIEPGIIGAALLAKEILSI